MNKVFLIAEAGVNHNGSLKMAKRLVDVAVSAGADAVKFQTFKAEKLVSRTAPKAEYQLRTTSTSQSQFQMIKELELDESAHRVLVEYCRKKRIEFLSTPFDLDSLDFLVDQLNVTRLKLSSGEMTNGPLLLKAAQAKKPILLSTGASTLGEVEKALQVLAFGFTQTRKRPCCDAFKSAYHHRRGQQILREKVTLLHCTTEYPVPFNDVNLRAMDTLRAAFGLSVGLSDHTLGMAIPIAAVARGAMVIEKHFTINRGLAGPDHRVSLEPDELIEMVRAIRQVEQALGDPIKIPVPSELKNQNIIRRSLVATRVIQKGKLLNEKNVAAKRPGTGVSPMDYWKLAGKKARKEYQVDEFILSSEINGLY